jgi:hypothetical protein
MKLLKATTTYACLLYSAAMILDEDPAILMTEIGHEGKFQAWPELRVPFCYATFHIQEIIDCALRRGRALVPIQARPRSSPDTTQNLKPHEPYPILIAHTRYINYLSNHTAILIGVSKRGNPHAVAWDGHYIHDPYDGLQKSLDDFDHQEAWILI